MKVRSSQISREVAGLLRARLMLYVAAGSIEIYTLTEDHFAEAERLIGRFACSHRLRTLDALQLAVALDLYEQNLLDYFVVADRALAEVSASVDLKVIDPERDDQPEKLNR
jgi:predicted nucleic acid-binding protein